MVVGCYSSIFASLSKVGRPGKKEMLGHWKDWQSACVSGEKDLDLFDEKLRPV